MTHGNIGIKYNIMVSLRKQFKSSFNAFIGKGETDLERSNFHNNRNNFPIQ